LTVLLIGTLFQQIIVNEKLFIYDWTTKLSIVLTIWAVVALHKPNSIMKKRLEEKNKNIVLTTIAFIIAVPVLTKLTFEQSIPNFLHFLTKEPAQITVTIDKKVSLKRCRNGVQLKGYEYIQNGRVFGLRKDILDIVTTGDQLKLIGEKSPFGFTTTAYRYEKVNLPHSKPARKVAQTPYLKNLEEMNLMISEKDLKTFYDYIDE
jgi:hypothetical protein